MKITNLNRFRAAGFPVRLGFLLLVAGGTLWSGAGSQAKIVGKGKEYRMEHTPPQNEPPKPNPKLSPEEVVSIVLQALQHNDTPTKNSGIAITFGFASPANRAITGPLDRFIELVNNPLYKPMLNHRHAERGSIRVAGDMARQRVTLFDAEGRRAIYIFTLSKQQEEPYKDCWMTDGVERVPDTNEPDLEIAGSNGHLAKRRGLGTFISAPESSDEDEV